MWYHLVSGQPQGPIDDASFDRLVAQGAITNETPVWKEGLPQWTPLGQVQRAVAPAVMPSLSALGTCTLCGKSVNADDLIDLAGQRVCAACKPEAVQKLREGVTITGLGDAWREKKSVVTRDQAVLPPRCFKCNHPVDGPPLKRKLYWHHPAFYFLIFLHVFIYIIVAIIVRKRATASVYLCPGHKTLRTRFIVLGWCSFIVGLIVALVAFVDNMPLLGTGSILFVIILGLVSIYKANITRATKIKAGVIWLRGAGKDFLASLPEWPG